MFADPGRSPAPLRGTNPCMRGRTAPIWLLALIASAGTLRAAPQTTEPPPHTAPRTESAPSPAAANTQGPNDVARLIDDLAAAHRRGSGPPAALQGFAATMVFYPERKDHDRISVTTEVRFRLDGPRIRYRADEGDRRIERGRDRRGSWIRIGDTVSDLADKDLERDREQLKKDIRLARQLLQLIDPARFARRIEADASVGQAPLPGARAKTDCRTLSGTLDEFPFYAAAGEQHRARVRLFLAPDTNVLVAVQATPIDAAGRATAAGELYHMSDHKEHDGVLLPTTLAFYRIDDHGTPLPEAKIVLERVDLTPDLGESTFDRG